MTAPLPEKYKDMVIVDAENVEEVASQVDFCFCAVNMKKDEIRDLEDRYAKAECPIVSNNSAHRFTDDVPMVIPEINADHIKIIDAQRKRLGTKRGFVAVKSNCSLQSYVPALFPLSEFGALDKQNAPMIADSITPRQTKFETNKEKLRQTIRKALATAASFDEFSSLLLREGVTVKESRGRLSYLTPDRTKPITARKLGDDFDRAAIFAVLEQNAARATEQPAAIPEHPRQGKTGIQPAKAPQTAPKQDGVQRLVNIEQKMAEGKGRGYERWATMHNLKQMAATLNVYQEYGFTSPEQLEAAVDTAYQEMRQTSGKLKTLETKLQGKKELQRQVLAYAKTKPARDGLKAQKSEKARAAYRQANESDFIIAEAAVRYFKAHGITKLPARKALQAEIEQLISEKDGLYNTYHEQKQRFKELQTVKRNIDQILRREEPRRRKEQSHER